MLMLGKPKQDALFFFFVMPILSIDAQVGGVSRSLTFTREGKSNQIYFGEDSNVQDQYHNHNKVAFIPLHIFRFATIFTCNQM
jgi:hypothetical protein